MAKRNKGMWAFLMICILVFITQSIGAMAAIPSVRWLNQSPADITTTNIIDDYLTIFYEIQDADAYLNLSTILLYAKSNTTTNDISYYENGTGYTGFNITRAYSLNVSDEFKWVVGDSTVYPATYNFDWTYTRTAAHSSGTLSTDNYWLWVELLNVSTAKSENYFEVMINNSAGTDYSKIYYCNSSYTTGNPTTSGYCVHIYNIPTNTMSHCHTAQSCHMEVPFGISSGKISTIDVSATSIFLMQGRSGSTINYWYISNTTRNGAAKTSSNNGITWTVQAFTVDSHLHQYDGTDQFVYYACASDDVNVTCDTEVINLFTSGDVPELPTEYTPVFTTLSCPIDDLQTTVMYIFIGFLILGFVIFAEYSMVPGLSVIAGVIGIFYSFPMWGCQWIYGAMIMLLSVVYMLWGVKWKWEG